MARRRMFSLDIIDTDFFIDLPQSSQNLYFHLALRADDDGFVASPKKIQKMVNAADDDMKLLTAKGFIIPFQTGICVITHWKIHNLIQKDRYKETIYTGEKSLLKEGKNGAYLCIQDVSKMDTQVSIGKVRQDKDSIGNRFIIPTVEQIKEYCTERNNKIDPDYFFNYYQSKGWMIGKNKMKDWKSAVRTWEKREKEFTKDTPKKTPDNLGLMSKLMGGNK